MNEWFIKGVTSISMAFSGNTCGNDDEKKKDQDTMAPSVAGHPITNGNGFDAQDGTEVRILTPK